MHPYETVGIDADAITAIRRGDVFELLFYLLLLLLLLLRFVVVVVVVLGRGKRREDEEDKSLRGESRIVSY